MLPTFRRFLKHPEISIEINLQSIFTDSNPLCSRIRNLFTLQEFY